MDINLLPDEKIKIIENFPNYSVTSFGRIWSSYCGGHWLKPTINKRNNHKRLYVSLGRGNKQYVHRLVAQAFIPNPNNLDEVDHIDGDSTNNNVTNLRWVTHQDNMDNNITKERIKKNGGAKVEIEEISTGKLFKGYEEAAVYSGLHRTTILNHTKGKVKNPKWRLTGRKYSYHDKHLLDVNI